MYTLKELYQYKSEVESCKIALENGQLMNCIVLVDDSEWYGDDDKDYLVMAIIDDIDKKRDDFPTAINYFNNSLSFIIDSINEMA